MTHEETAGTPYAESPLEDFETLYRRSWFAGSARRTLCVRSHASPRSVSGIEGVSSAALHQPAEREEEEEEEEEGEGGGEKKMCV